VEWRIEWTQEFAEWLVSTAVDAAAREDIRASLLVLRDVGPALGRPHADTLKGSRHANMKELRVQSRGRPFRVLFAFDPRRHAILLVGGDKAGYRLFYQRMIPTADRLYDEHLARLKYVEKKKHDS
jgi:hypothetical protein